MAVMEWEDKPLVWLHGEIRTVIETCQRRLAEYDR